MDITTIVIITVALIVGYKIGQWSILAQLVNEVKGVSKALEEAIEDQELIRIERVNDHYYAYGAEDRFLAQGSDFTSMFSIIKDRFPGQDFRIDKTQLNFTTEEHSRMVESIFEVFGKKEESK